jgi:hypothetical protein
LLLVAGAQPKVHAASTATWTAHAVREVNFGAVWDQEVAGADALHQALYIKLLDVSTVGMSTDGVEVVPSNPDIVYGLNRQHGGTSDGLEVPTITP